MLMAPATHGLLSVIAIAPVFTVAPVITGNTAGPGQAYNNDTLSVNFTVTGQPAPTLSYQWVREDSSTVFSTAAVVTSAFFGTTIHCTVIATNAAGTVPATTASMFLNQSVG
jgi:hypothetical protein